MPIPIPSVTGWPQAPQNYLNPASVYDPMAGVFNQMAISKFMDERDNARMRRKLDEMYLQEAQKGLELERQTAEIGKKELMGLSPTTSVTPGPEQQGIMRNLLGGNYQPSIQGRATAPTPQGPMDVANLQANPEAGAKMLMAGRAMQQEQQRKTTEETLKDARTRVNSMFEKGNDEQFQAYKKFLAQNPITASLAQELEGIKLTGMGKGEGQKFYSSDMLKALDPEGKLTDGTPGIYDFSFDGPSRKLKKIKPDRDMLINSATNGTPAEKQWATTQMQGREQYEPVNLYRDFKAGEMLKLRKAHPDWSPAQMEGEVATRWQAIQVEQAGKKIAEQEKVKKEAWTPEVTKLVDAIKRGEQPPDLSGLSRKPEILMQAKAKFAEDGYDLNAANLDWIAQKKYMQTLNGPQQLRLRQATNFASDSLDLLQGLVNEWDAGPYPILNKANLVLAQQGAFGPEAAKIATQLDTQISDLTSELGTVYKGGNSSTDESLKLAAKNLSSNWSKEVLTGNIDLIRQNLTIRRNSIKHTGPITTKGGIEEPEKGKKTYTQADIDATIKAHPGTTAAQVEEALKKKGWVKK